jgi:hypothetical protein
VLDEYFHKDHADNKKQCVVMQNCRPSSQILDVLKFPEYDGQVFYLEGDPYDINELKRSDFHRADSIVILNDKLAKDASVADTQVIL